jgi:hypothetical protein
LLFFDQVATTKSKTNYSFLFGKRIFNLDYSNPVNGTLIPKIKILNSKLTVNKTSNLEKNDRTKTSISNVSTKAYTVNYSSNFSRIYLSYQTDRYDDEIV